MDTKISKFGHNFNFVGHSELNLVSISMFLGAVPANELFNKKIHMSVHHLRNQNGQIF